MKDFFENIEKAPKKVQVIVEKYANDENTHEDCQRLEQELEAVGWTIEYGLDFVPQNLQRKKKEPPKTSFIAKVVMEKTVHYTRAEDRLLKNSQDCHRAFLPLFNDALYSHEEFHVIALNHSHLIIGSTRLSSGGLTATIADTRMIFRFLLLCGATAFAVAHNHPSENPKPSNPDIQLTKKLSEAARLMDMTFIDHIIICGDSQYVSFADEGLM
jgi:DNA repair protein RadC